MASREVTIARCSRTGRRSPLLSCRERQNAGQNDISTDLQFAISARRFPRIGRQRSTKFRKLDDAAMIEKASSEVRGTLCKLRRSSVMVQEADPWLQARVAFS